MKRAFLSATLFLLGACAAWSPVPYEPRQVRLQNFGEDFERLIRTSRVTAQPDKIDATPAYATFFYIGKDGISKDTLVFSNISRFELLKKDSGKNDERTVEFYDAKNRRIFRYYATDEKQAEEFIDFVMSAAHPAAAASGKDPGAVRL